MRNWLMGRASLDAQASDLLRVAPQPQAAFDMPLRAPQPHHFIDLDGVTTNGLHVSPFGGVGTSGAFTGTGGNDHLVGSAADDTFDASQGGNDKIEGGDGNDFIDMGAAFTAKDHIDGGSDTFTAGGGDDVQLIGDYSGGLKFKATTLVNVEFVDLYGASEGGGNYGIKLNDGTVGAGQFIEIFGAQSSSGTSWLHINGSAETDGDLDITAAGRGDDILIGGDRNDLINGGAGGNDFFNGGDGFDRVSFSSASAAVTVSLAKSGIQDVGGGRLVTVKNFEAVSGSRFNDVLIGSKQANYLSTLGGNDTINAGKGDDFVLVNSNLTPIAYAVTVAGSSGDDTLGFTSTRGGVEMSLALQGSAQSTGINGTVNASGFENLGGTSGFADVLTGNDADNNLYGDGGNDVLRGGKGNDHLYGDNGFGLITTDAANIGASGPGAFERASGGSDILQGGEGNDVLDGGAGIDTADYSDATGSGVTVDLSVLTAQDVGGGLGSDTLLNVEHVVGSQFNDMLSGNDSDNRLVGDDGADVLSGAGGADVLYGDLAPAIGITAVQCVSTSQDGTPGDMTSQDGQLSPDGMQVVFNSFAGNLTDDGTSFFGNVFVKDLLTGEVTRITHDPSGGQPNHFSGGASFSPDGKWVLFNSIASNLDGLDTNSDWDVFVANLATGEIKEVSTNNAGDVGSSLSIDPSFTPDGKGVLFASYATNLMDSDTNGFEDIFIKDLKTGNLTLVSTDSFGNQTNGRSTAAAISGDGTKVLFLSEATNLVAGDANGVQDAFVKDLVTGVVTRVSITADGTQINSDALSLSLNSNLPGIAISADGRMVAFASAATNLGVAVPSHAIDLFVKDTVTGTLTCISPTSETNALSFSPVFSPDGHYLAFSSMAADLVIGDTNGAADVFIRDLLTGVTTRLTMPDGTELSSGAQGCAFSADGTQLIVQSASAELPGHNDQDQEYVFSLNFLSNGNGNDTLSGGEGADVLFGGAGIDSLDGGSGSDAFVYANAAESTSTAFDTILGFDAAEDVLDAPVKVLDIDHRLHGATLSEATFDTDLAAVLDATHLGAHHAVLYKPGAGDHDGEQFLIVDVNGVAGYQAGEDIVVELQNALHLEDLSVDNFI